MKKTVLALILLVVMLPLSCYSVNEVKAETLGPPSMRVIPTTDDLVLFSPKNLIYNTHSILVNFTVAINGYIADVGYSLDNNEEIQRITNITQIYEEPAPDAILPPHLRITYMVTQELSYLADGEHTITVYHGSQNNGIVPEYLVFSFAETSFSIVTPAPHLQILDVCDVYNSSKVPLNFTIDEPASWMAYSMDKQANITLGGNITLTGLSEGSHTLVVYANDTAGNMGSSQIINFTVSPETQPIPEPEPFPITLVVIAVLVIIATLALVVVILAKLLVYYRKKTE